MTGQCASKFGAEPGLRRPPKYCRMSWSTGSSDAIAIVGKSTDKDQGEGKGEGESEGESPKAAGTRSQSFLGVARLSGFLRA